MKTLLIATATAVVAGAMCAGVAQAQAPGAAGEVCGQFDIGNGSQRSVGEICADAVRYNYRNGERNKVLVLPNSNYRITYSAESNRNLNGRPTGCRFRNGQGVEVGGSTSSGTGSRLMNCEVRFGNGGNRVTGPINNMRFRAGSGPAVPAGERGQLCGDFGPLTDGFNRTSAGRVCITADHYDFGNGTSRSVLVVPSNGRRAYQVEGNEGPRPRFNCSFRTSGNGFGGGGYLAAGDGSRADCTVTIGNGRNRASEQIELRFQR